MTPDQEFSLTGGGETNLHTHPETPTLDTLHRLHELEKVVTVTGDYTASKSDDILRVTTGSAIVITLPSASGGQHLTIVATVAPSITVTPSASDTINGASSHSITTAYKPLRLKALKGIGYMEI